MSSANGFEHDDSRRLLDVILSGGPPWGFTLTGGSEFGSRLYIKKVSEASKAISDCLNVGDEILSVNGVSCTSREVAIQIIRSVEDELRLKICRWKSNSHISPKKNPGHNKAFYNSMVDSIMNNMTDLSKSYYSSSRTVPMSPGTHAGNPEAGRYQIVSINKDSSSNEHTIRIGMPPSLSPPLKMDPPPPYSERSVDVQPEELVRSSSDGGQRQAKKVAVNAQQAVSCRKSTAQTARAYQNHARSHSQDASSLLGNGAVEPADRLEHVVRVSTARAFFESATHGNESQVTPLKTWKSGPVLVSSRDIATPEQRSVQKDLRRTLLTQEALPVPKHEHSRSLPVEDYPKPGHSELHRPASADQRSKRDTKDIERSKSAYSVAEHTSQQSVDDADDEDGSSCESPPAAPPRYSHSDLLRSFRGKGSYDYEKVKSSYSSEDLRFVQDDDWKSKAISADKPANSADELRLAASRYHKELLRNYPGVRHSLTGKDPLQKLPRKTSVPAEESFSRTDLVRATVGGTGSSYIPRSQSAQDSSQLREPPENFAATFGENSIMSRLLREQSPATLVRIDEEAAAKSRRGVREASDESERVNRVSDESARGFVVESESEEATLSDSSDMLHLREVKSKALSSPKHLTDVERTVNVPSSGSLPLDAGQGDAVSSTPVRNAHAPGKFSSPSIQQTTVPLSQSLSPKSGERPPPLPPRGESPGHSAQSTSPTPTDRGPKPRAVPLKTEARVVNSYFVPLKAETDEPRSISSHANENSALPSSARAVASSKGPDRKLVDDKHARSVKQKSLDFETAQPSGGDQIGKRAFVRQKSVDSVLDSEEMVQPHAAPYFNTGSGMEFKEHPSFGPENGPKLVTNVVSAGAWQSNQTVLDHKRGSTLPDELFALDYECPPRKELKISHAKDPSTDSMRELAEIHAGVSDVLPQVSGDEDLNLLPPPPEELLVDDDIDDAANDEVDGADDQTAEREKPQRTINRRKKDPAVGSRNNSCVSTDSTTSTCTADSGIGLRSDSSPRTSPGMVRDYFYDDKAGFKGSREMLDDDEGMIDECTDTRSTLDRNEEAKMAGYQLLHQRSVDSKEGTSSGSSTSNSRPDSLVFTSRKDDLDAEKLRLIESMREKIRELSLQESEIADEIKVNEELGARVLRMVEAKATQTEFAKYELFIGELNKIVALLLSLTQRLHRYELMLQELDMSNDQEKAKRDELVSKIDKLKSQHEEACYLREVNDKRGENVASFLEKYCSEEEFADFQYYVDMKSQLALMRSEISEKVKLGEERLKALESTGTDW